jgi:hypothetical protein
MHISPIPVTTPLLHTTTASRTVWPSSATIRATAWSTWAAACPFHTAISTATSAAALRAASSTRTASVHTTLHAVATEAAASTMVSLTTPTASPAASVCAR